MATGWGTAPVDIRTTHINLSDLQLRAAAGDTVALLQLIERHLQHIEAKYVEPALFTPQQITIKASGTVFGQRLDFSTQIHNSVIANVVTGTLNLWIGDYNGIGQQAQPHFQFVAGSTVQLFFPLAGRVYTVVNPSSTDDLVCCLTPVAL